MIEEELRISIAGTGKAAKSLGLAMRKSGVNIVEVWGRDLSKSVVLAKELGATHISDPNEFSEDVDAIAVLVKDDAIKSLSTLMPVRIPKFHASGTTPLSELNCNVAGVFWPIKSINTESIHDGFKGVPIGIEATSSSFYSLLTSIASLIEAEGFKAEKDARLKIHLAAVFTDNFANHCLALSQEILEQADLDKALMKSLAEGLVKGSLLGNSKSRQTGVAIRGDKLSQERHLNLLTEDKRAFYEFLSNEIAKHHEL
mgnify:FL=1|tara:strand:- start:173 stop:943 length:771 start_codon:yes stop_codon:yes gene_type:complete